MSAQGKSQRQIADHFGVGKTQVRKTLKRKAETQVEFEAGAPLSKRLNSKPTGNEQINELVYKWFVDATRRRINVTGPMMQEKALQFATDLGITTLVASNGWLQSFVKRNNLAFGKLCGELGDVDGPRFSLQLDRLLFLPTSTKLRKKKKAKRSTAIMPLPPALLARLAKRGIVEEEKESKPDATGSTKAGAQEEVEEVFAEDYDDPSKPEQEEQIEPEVVQQQVPALAVPVLPPEVRDIVGDGPLFHETVACPNRGNPFHECVPYCKKKYGMREWDPDEDMTKKRDRMLQRYPLPEGWVEVGDYDSGRYYYWNVHTDDVSWLSPSHPKSVVSKSAEQLGLVSKTGNLDSEGEETMDTSQDLPPSDHEAEDQSSEDSDTSLSDEEDTKRSKQRGR
ncbi:polyglutamine-binding protein 1, partial [Elysia marginata]